MSILSEKEPGQFSFWERESLAGKPDVAIAGAGIVGLFTAFFLKKLRPEWQISVFERSAWSAGASTRNAGFACFGSLSELLDDLNSMSESEVFALVEKRWRGLQLLRQTVGDARMDFEPSGGVELFKPSDNQLAEECLDFLPRANALLSDIIGSNAFEFTSDRFGLNGIGSTVFSKYEGKLNTGKLYKSLMDLTQSVGVKLFFGCEITGFEEDPTAVRLFTPHGTLKADKLAICTNGFARQLLPEAAVRPARNLVLVSQPIGFQPGPAFHYDRGYVYFREIAGRLLIGGARNMDLENEFTDRFGTNEKVKTALTAIAKEVIVPGKEIKWEYEWSGIMGVGPTKSPIIGKTGSRTHHAVRMGGMGVALGSLVGRELADNLSREEL